MDGGKTAGHSCDDHENLPLPDALQLGTSVASRLLIAARQLLQPLFRGDTDEERKENQIW
jgi:hypothetical protein